MVNNRKTSAKTVLIDTLERLLHQKPFQKISVNELCESALVSRSAFYANFEDKYDLLSCCLEFKSEHIHVLMNTHKPEEFLTVILDVIQKENRIFYNIFGAEPEQEVVDIFYSFFEKQFLSVLDKHTKESDSLPGPAEIVCTFCVGGLSASTLRWIKSNYKIPKEELAACQYRLLKDIL